MERQHAAVQRDRVEPHCTPRWFVGPRLGLQTPRSTATPTATPRTLDGGWFLDARHPLVGGRARSGGRL